MVDRLLAAQQELNKQQTELIDSFNRALRKYLHSDQNDAFVRELVSAIVQHVEARKPITDSMVHEISKTTVKRCYPNPIFRITHRQDMKIDEEIVFKSLSLFIGKLNQVITYKNKVLVLLIDQTQQ